MSGISKNCPMSLNSGFSSIEVRLQVLSIMPKFSEILVEKQMERGNFPFKVLHLQRWSSLTGRSALSETCRSFSKNSRFQPYFARQ